MELQLQDSFRRRKLLDLISAFFWAKINRRILETYQAHLVGEANYSYDGVLAVRFSVVVVRTPAGTTQVSYAFLPLKEESCLPEAPLL